MFNLFSFLRFGRLYIKGKIVRRCRDEYGEIIIAEEGSKRSMYFSDGALQSSIRLDNPALLTEVHNHAIMSALMFRETPGSVLIIGLGGCSLVNFLLSAFPGCAIEVVEIRQKVIDLAHELFLMQEGRVNLKIFHLSGQDFMKAHSSGKYDMIIVDAFDDNGPAFCLTEQEFLFACRERLSREGIFAMNLWNRPKDKFPVLYERIQKVFGNRTLKLPLGEAYHNAIVFGFGDEVAYNDIHSYRGTAKHLQKKYGINFLKYLRSLYSQNFDPETQGV